MTKFYIQKEKKIPEDIGLDLHTRAEVLRISERNARDLSFTTGNTYAFDDEKNKIAYKKFLTRKRKQSCHPLRKMRLERGFTLEELGQLTGLSPSYLSRLESGGRRLNADILKPIAKVLSCHPGDLLSPESYPFKYASSPWLHIDVPQQLSPVLAQDLPLHTIICDQEGRLYVEEGEPKEWIARPPELYGVIGAFAFTLQGAGWVNPRYRHTDRILAHPTRPLTPECGIVVIMNDGGAYIGQFNRWLTVDNDTEDLEITITEYPEHREHAYPTDKQIILKRADIRLAHRIIGMMEAA
jgi:transcriptional regulator with XRE-family HTH domain